MSPDVKGKAVTSDVKGKTKATGAKGKTKATSLKQFLSNLATDARKLGEFLHEPEAAMSAANLSEEDKTALRSGVAGMVAARLAGVPLDQAFKLMVYPVLVYYPYPMKLTPESPMFAAYPQKVAAQPPMFGMYPQKVAAESVPLIYMKQPPLHLIVHQPFHYVVYPPQFVVQPTPQYMLYPPQFVVQWPYYPQ